MKRATRDSLSFLQVLLMMTASATGAESTDAKITPPVAGRPDTYIGFVGSLQALATASPTELAPMETTQWRIELRGSGDWTDTGAIDLRRQRGLVERFELVAGPITEKLPNGRIETYTLRPKTREAGETIIPAVAVSYFNPTTRRYETTRTRSIPLRITAPPPPGSNAAVDPAPPTEAVTEETDDARNWPFAAFIVGAIATALLVAGFVWRERRGNRSASQATSPLSLNEPWADLPMPTDDRQWATVRQLIADRLRLLPGERTTTEVIDALRRHDCPPDRLMEWQQELTDHDRRRFSRSSSAGEVGPG